MTHGIEPAAGAAVLKVSLSNPWTIGIERVLGGKGSRTDPPRLRPLAAGESVPRTTCPSAPAVVRILTSIGRACHEDVVGWRFQGVARDASRSVWIAPEAISSNREGIVFKR